jgi:hypothetical protein
MTKKRSTIAKDVTLEDEMLRFARLTNDDIFPLWIYGFDEAVELARKRRRRTRRPTVLVQPASDAMPCKDHWKQMKRYNLPLVCVSNIYANNGTVTEELRKAALTGLSYRARGLQKITPPPVDRKATEELQRIFDGMPQETEEERRKFLKKFYNDQGSDHTR